MRRAANFRRAVGGGCAGIVAICSVFSAAFADQPLPAKAAPAKRWLDPSPPAATPAPTAAPTPAQKTAAPLAAPGAATGLAEPATPSVAELPDVESPPAWMQWLGWSSDGRRIAWRQGSAKQQPRVADPIEIARVDDRGGIVQRLQVRENVAAALASRQIHLVAPVAHEQVTPADVLLRTASGRLYAVIIRGQAHPTATVLEKHGDSYDPVAQWPVRGPATRVEANGFEEQKHRFMAVMAQTGLGNQRQTHIVVLPLLPTATAAP